MAGFIDNLRSKREREKNAKAAILANEAQTGEEYLSSLSRHRLNQIPANMRSQGRGQALETPMFSPDDLIGTGLITKGATLAASTLSPLAAMAGLSSLAARRGVTTNPNRLAQLMSGQAGAFAIGKNPILHNGKEVGYLKLDDSGNALRIADIEITPSMRNQGIGSNAIKEVMAQAKESGKPVVLTSDAMRGKEAQKAQRALYQRLGFEKNSKLKTDGVKEEFVWQGEKQAPKTEFELAHELAQKNASLPIEQGGLGLPANNTAMDRAKAMGFDTPTYSGRYRDYKAPNRTLYTTQDPEYASLYTNPSASSMGKSASAFENLQPNVMPLMIKGDSVLDTRTAAGKKVFNNDFYRKYGNGTPLTERGLPDWVDAHDFGDMFADKGMKYKGVIADEGGIPNMDGGVTHRGLSTAIFDPTAVRSRFAAFDPMKRKSANLLAGGAIGATGLTLADLLNQEQFQ